MLKGPFPLPRGARKKILEPFFSLLSFFSRARDAAVRAPRAWPGFAQDWNATTAPLAAQLAAQLAFAPFRQNGAKDCDFRQLSAIFQNSDKNQ